MSFKLWHIGIGSSNHPHFFKLQKRAVRTVTGSNYIAHTERIFRNLEVLNINDIYKMQQLKLYYRLRNMQLPTYFYSMPFNTNYQLHQLPTYFYSRPFNTNYQLHQLPTYFYSRPFNTNYQLHQLNTRSSSNLHIIRVNHEFAKKMY